MIIEVILVVLFQSLSGFYTALHFFGKFILVISSFAMGTAYGGKGAHSKKGNPEKVKIGGTCYCC